jgi:hypothetical protein
MILIGKLFALLFAVGPTVTIGSGARQIIPTDQGMSWQYKMTQEAGPGIQFSDIKPGEDPRLRAAVIYRINGQKELDGKNLLEFEMHRAGQLTNTDLVTVDEQGVSCWARVDDNGELTRLTPPQTIVPSPLDVGVRWDFNAKVAGEDVRQNYTVSGEGEVVVPAGKFRAFHIHGEQTAPGRMVIDRWFVNGLGIIKDVTETRSDTGELFRRITLELMERPKILPRPDTRAHGLAKKLTVALSKEEMGQGVSEFASNTPKIYARWQGHNLKIDAKIRVLWIAENVSDVPPDYTIDEATTTATAADSHGVLTLARPETGWAPGNYRVEFYLDGDLSEAIKVKITP